MARSRLVLRTKDPGEEGRETGARRKEGDHVIHI
jgi:hypothetical protein